MGAGTPLPPFLYSHVVEHDIRLECEYALLVASNPHISTTLSHTL